MEEKKITNITPKTRPHTRHKMGPRLISFHFQQIDGETKVRKDKPCYRNARTHLKNSYILTLYYHHKHIRPKTFVFVNMRSDVSIVHFSGLSDDCRSNRSPGPAKFADGRVLNCKKRARKGLKKPCYYEKPR